MKEKEFAAMKCVNIIFATLDSYEEADRAVSDAEQSTIGDDEDFPNKDPALKEEPRRMKKRNACLLAESSDSITRLLKYLQYIFLYFFLAECISQDGKVIKSCSGLFMTAVAQDFQET